jgi:hypothetical protein
MNIQKAQLKRDRYIEEREAWFSDDGVFRYLLTAKWDGSLPSVTMIGLNPSIATAEQNDPTIRREIDFAQSLGFGGLIKLNAFALVSTDYKGLFRHPEPIGPDNTLDFLKHWSDGPMTIACWGAHITEKNWRHFYRGREIADHISNLYCLAKTKSGHPMHPLYLPRTARPIPFRYE